MIFLSRYSLYIIATTAPAYKCDHLTCTRELETAGGDNRFVHITVSGTTTLPVSSSRMGDSGRGTN